MSALNPVNKLLHSKKTLLQIALLVCGTVMLYFGISRGEAAMVLNKAVKLCLECVGIG